MDALDRMFHTLVRTLRTNHPPGLTTFTAGELHDQILPYRHFRRELGLETNGEYEHTLMQLLTGARGYLEVDERLRDTLAKELATPNPDAARLREVADAQVAVNAAKTAAIPVPRASGPIRLSSRCQYCGESLPPGRQSNFCPHCGLNLLVANCPACGAEVETGWKYCASCGKLAPESSR